MTLPVRRVKRKSERMSHEACYDRGMGRRLKVRSTITLEPDDLVMLDSLVCGVYESRSECIRALVRAESRRRELAERRRKAAQERPCANN